MSSLLRRYELFKQLNDSPTQEILIKKLRHSENYTTIITYYSKTTKIEVYNIEVKELEITPIVDTLSQKRLFERYHIKDLLTNLLHKEACKNDDSDSLVYSTAIIIDKFGQCDITFFLDQL